jgi:hypothetical protein
VVSLARTRRGIGKEQVMILAMTFAETWWIWLIVLALGVIGGAVIAIKSFGTVRNFDFDGHVGNMKRMAVAGGVTLLSLILLVVSLIFKFTGQS